MVISFFDRYLKKISLCVKVGISYIEGVLLIGREFEGCYC